MKKMKTQRLWCLLWALIISIGAFNASAVTIQAKATTATWTEPCVWYWGGGSQQNTANPMQFVSEDGTDSWWTFELPNEATGFLFKNISNGSDWTLQSANVNPPTLTTCYKLSSTNQAATEIIDCPIVTEPTVTLLLYTPFPIIIGDEVTFAAATENFSGDPTIVYSVNIPCYQLAFIHF